MKQLSTLIVSVSMCYCCVAQSQVQQLNVSRLSVFKNGTYFVKKSGTLKTEDKKFIMEAPANVLMGGYWLSTGKDNPFKSITIKDKVIKVKNNTAIDPSQLSAYINNTITLINFSTKANTLAGTLLAYNNETRFVKIKTADGKIVFTNLNNYDQYIVTEDKPGMDKDSTVVLAEVQLSNTAATVNAATLSLEKGIQWIPSYLLTIKNDKEATLQLKATIVNGKQDFLNTEVDIIVGNPEMFYKETLDPICANYIYGDVFERNDNNRYNNAQFLSNNISAVGEMAKDNADELDPAIRGEKLEDLFIYKLGNLSLAKNARVIVPITSADITYEDIYTTTIAAYTPEKKELPIDVIHNYRIKNSTNAPFTTAPILVMDNTEMPLAQAQLKYTPVKGMQDIYLSKAIDVTVANEEAESNIEKTNKKYNGNILTKVSLKGSISLHNFQNKKIKILITKTTSGTIVNLSDNGKFKAFKSNADYTDNTNILRWEIELQPNEKKEIAYTYYIMKDSQD
jgi:hypothetical protein